MDQVVENVRFFMRVGRQVIGTGRAEVPKPGMLLGTYLGTVAVQLHDHARALKSYGDRPDEQLMALRARLILEEAAELLEAMEQGNTAGVADALADLVYVAVGAAIAWAIPFAHVWALVHVANMAKFVPCVPHPDPPPECGECGGTGWRRYVDASGKIAKPPGWTAPDVAGLLKRWNR